MMLGRLVAGLPLPGQERGDQFGRQRLGFAKTVADLQDQIKALLSA